MGKVDISQFQGYPEGQVIAAALGAIILAVTDFAGYHFISGNTIEDRDRVCLIGCGRGATRAILVGLVGLIIALYFAIQSLQAKEDITPMLLKKNARNSMLGGAFTAAYALLGAIYWIATNLGTNWGLIGIVFGGLWLRTGFYGAFLGGLLTALFAFMMFVKIEV